MDRNRFLDQFEATFGKFEGFRRSGAKGVCAVGEFVGSAEGRALSVASAFNGKPVPVVMPEPGTHRHHRVGILARWGTTI